MKVVEILEEIKSTSKSTEKLAIMKKNADNIYFKSALYYSSDPFKPFHVAKVPRVKATERAANLLSEETAWPTFYSLLDQCASRSVTGNTAIDLLHSLFQTVDKNTESWMRNVLNKHLAIGISVKSINKAFPGFIPTFEVSLAQKFDMKRIGNRKTVAVEPKLDGIRCFSTCGCRRWPGEWWRRDAGSPQKPGSVVRPEWPSAAERLAAGYRPATAAVAITDESVADSRYRVRLC